MPPDHESIARQIFQVHDDSQCVVAGNLFALRTTISTTISTMRAYDDSLEPCPFDIAAGARQVVTSLLGRRISGGETFLREHESLAARPRQRATTAVTAIGCRSSPVRDATQASMQL